LGKDKAQCLAACFLILPVENQTCGFDRIRLSTFGPSPWTIHAASVRIAPAPQGHAPWTAHAVAASLGSHRPTGEGPSPSVRILGSVACPRADSSAPSATPRRPRDCVQALPLSPGHFPAHPARRCPCSPWKTQTERGRGRVALLAPAALCGSPVCAQSVAQVDRWDRGHAIRSAWPWSFLAALVSDCGRDWLTSSTREVRGSVPRRA
jgi:hypothetical protein